jgi:molybdopterin-binding protein
MKLSARNVLKGKVVGVIKGVTTHNVKIDIGHGIVITSSITAEAVRDLKLKEGRGLRHHQSYGGDRRQGLRQVL